MNAARILAVLLAAAPVALWADTAVPQAPHSVLDAMGPQAAHIVDLWRIFVILCALFFGGILAAVLIILMRTPRAAEGALPDLGTVNQPEPIVRRNVTRAVALSVLGLVLLVIASVFTDRAIASLSLKDAVNIEITSHQWWWTARYVNGPPSDTFETANEIHVPVGRPVVVKLFSDDVIHSLWLPNLAGKRDLIPGRTSVISFQADKPGIYRGQCAEFCGFQHAHMGLLVIAEPTEQYDKWLQGQRTPAPEPSDAQAVRGKALFQSLSCAMCHSVSGTLAQGKHAPDLSHVASRQTLAAGTLKNTPKDLASWIADPQKHKPGTTMPATPMSQQDLQAIVAYLGTLK